MTHTKLIPTATPPYIEKSKNSKPLYCRLRIKREHYILRLSFIRMGIWLMFFFFFFVKDPQPITAKAVDIEVDEFLPEVNESNLFVLQNAGEQAVLLTATQPDDEKSEELEIPTELLIRDTIPEIEEHLDSSSDDDDCLTGPAVTAVKQSHKPTRTESDEIEFKSGYFKQNSSSSSDDDSITRGLSFQDLTQLDGSATHNKDSTDSGAYVDRKHKNSMSTGSIVPNLMSELVSWGAENLIKYKLTQSLTEGNGSGRKHQTARPPDKHGNRMTLSADSSDDSEFEILTTDELNQETS